MGAKGKNAKQKENEGIGDRRLYYWSQDGYQRLTGRRDPPTRHESGSQKVGDTVKVWL